MEQMQTIISRKYDVDRQLYDLRLELLKLEEEYPQHLYAFRQAKESLNTYSAGNLSAFWDKLFGGYENTKSQLAIELRCAQVTLSSCKIQLDSCKNMISSLESDFESLPSREELFAIYPDSDFLNHQDAYFCAHCLLPALDKNHEYLLAARDWAENRRTDFKAHGTQFDKSVALKRASEYATQACQLMEQIIDDGFIFEIHPYFRNPDGFIAAVARQYGQQDRINYAISAVRAATSTASDFLENIKEALKIE